MYKLQDHFLINSCLSEYDKTNIQEFFFHFMQQLKLLNYKCYIYNYAKWAYSIPDSILAVKSGSNVCLVVSSDKNFDCQYLPSISETDLT